MTTQIIGNIKYFVISQESSNVKKSLNDKIEAMIMKDMQKLKNIGDSPDSQCYNFTDTSDNCLPNERS